MLPMGVTSDNVAKTFNITRLGKPHITLVKCGLVIKFLSFLMITLLEQDQFAYESHCKACHAQSKDLFKEEIIEIDGVKQDDGFK
jgi:acetyl-CoA acetyltransferase